MQVKRILKSDEKEKAYYNFTLQHEVYTLRWLGIIGFGYTLVFLIIDIDRATHYTEVLISRSVALLLYALSTGFAFSDRTTVKSFHLVCYILSTSLFGIGFLIDLTGGMPIFFLTNYICIYLFAFNAALGHPLRFKIIQTLALFIFYIFYTKQLSLHSSIHTAQSWNLLVNCTLSLVIGALIERYKVLNFQQQAQLLESRKKNEELNNLKSRLISVLSHDLASPLNNLTALLHLKESNKISGSELDSSSKKIKESLENLSSMMRNLLKWSKSQLEGFQPQREKIDLTGMVSEVISTLEYASSQKEIRILNEVKEFNDLYLDHEVLKIVIRNFLANAIKFSNKDDLIIVSSHKEKNSIVLSVRDTGIGMSAEQLGKLFSSSDTSTPGTYNERGAGIGLVITKDFVEMMGGSISVKSEEGEGSEFSVTFPIER